MNQPFGSRIVTPSGILMNSQILDFSWPNKSQASVPPNPVLGAHFLFVSMLFWESSVKSTQTVINRLYKWFYIINNVKWIYGLISNCKLFLFLTVHTSYVVFFFFPSLFMNYFFSITQLCLVFSLVSSTTASSPERGRSRSSCPPPSDPRWESVVLTWHSDPPTATARSVASHRFSSFTAFTCYYT